MFEFRDYQQNFDSVMASFLTLRFCQATHPILGSLVFFLKIFFFQKKKKKKNQEYHHNLLISLPVLIWFAADCMVAIPFIHVIRNPAL